MWSLCHWDSRSQGRLLEVFDVVVPLRFAFQAVASKLCFRGKSQLKLRCWWM